MPSLDFLAGNRPLSKLCRTFTLVEGRVSFENGSTEPDLPMHELGTFDLCWTALQ